MNNVELIEKELEKKINQYVNSHPKFIKMWEHYIFLKKQEYIRSLNQCRKAFDLLENENLKDMSQEDLFKMFSSMLIISLSDINS